MNHNYWIFLFVFSFTLACSKKKICSDFHKVKLEVNSDLDSNVLSMGDSILLTLTYTDEQLDAEDGEEINISKVNVKSYLEVKARSFGVLGLNNQANARNDFEAYS